MGFIVAIDGPAGAGKSTVSRRVADRLGLVLIDTGAIYRTAALLAHRKSLTEERAIAAELAALDLEFAGGRVLLAGEDVSQAIRTPEISLLASHVSAMPAVRQALLELQRRSALRNARGAVVEGRDIGTVVFPDAPLKIFLTASIEERARRRHEELQRGGGAQSFEEVRDEIRRRDEKDSQRAVAPLKAASDACRVDTTGRSIEEIVEEIARLAEKAEAPS
ncbi:MAG: (d)CMP kinase [Deltaproteobacteria bacterium]|nr:(d)CMP kinase [Deltaproteobacteria bacterium]